jgi:hypothetical protein
VGAGVVARDRGSLVGGGEHLALGDNELEERLQERPKAIGGRGAGTERRRAADHRLLEFALALVDERHQQPRLSPNAR